MLHIYKSFTMQHTHITATDITHLGESSPVSSSPSTPTRRTVSSIPAVWYLNANAFSSGKNPICKLKNITR
jgi:hypothetical protein